MTVYIIFKIFTDFCGQAYVFTSIKLILAAKEFLQQIGKDEHYLYSYITCSNA